MVGRNTADAPLLMHLTRKSTHMRLDRGNRGLGPPQRCFKAGLLNPDKPLSMCGFKPCFGGHAKTI